MKISLRLVGCAVGLAALALTGASAQEPAFNIQFVSQFDYPGTGNQTRPQKISDRGDVVGIFVDSSGVSAGFTMLKNGNFSAPIVDPNDAANLTEARGINSSRLICGDYVDSAGAFEGYFLMNHTFTNYDIEPTFTIVLGVNNAGDFAGSVIPSSGVQSAFVSIGGTVTDFAVPHAAATLAYQINSTNQSCGYYNDSLGASHGFYRESNGTVHGPIDPAGSTTTILFGNNDRNFIVGRYIDSGGATHGILFVPPSHFVVYDFPGATFTSLNGINKRGQIVGRYTDPNTFIDHGILLQLQSGSASVTLPLAPASAQTQALPDRAINTAPAY